MPIARRMDLNLKYQYMVFWGSKFVQPSSQLSEASRKAPMYPPLLSEMMEEGQ